jgi:hypothetical protein
MASLANRLLFLARKFEEVGLLILDFVAKVASEFQVSDARRLKIKLIDPLK